jgi:hypothetical protein
MTPFFSDRSGSFELTSVKQLPNAQVAHSGEHWSNRKASGAITPGAAVVPLASGSSPDATMVMRTAINTDVATQLAVALKTVQVPDPNLGPGSLGPNEIVNLPIVNQEYIHAYYSGVLRLTLVTPDTYVPGDLVGWDANGVLPASKPGTVGLAAGLSSVGAWAKDANADIKSVFEVLEWEEVNSSTHEGILTVRFVGRSQF